MLLDGQVLIARLGLTKGPVIGAMLAKVRNAQLDGLIRTRAQALQFLTEHADIVDSENTLPTKPSSQKNPLFEKQAGE